MKDRKIYFLLSGLIAYVLLKNLALFILLFALLLMIIFDKVTGRKEVYYFDITLVGVYIFVMLLTINTTVEGIKPLISAYGCLVLERRI